MEDFAGKNKEILIGMKKYNNEFEKLIEVKQIG